MACVRRSGTRRGAFSCSPAPMRKSTSESGARRRVDGVQVMIGALARTSAAAEASTRPDSPTSGLRQRGQTHSDGFEAWAQWSSRHPRQKMCSQTPVVTAASSTSVHTAQAYLSSNFTDSICDASAWCRATAAARLAPLTALSASTAACARARSARAAAAAAAAPSRLSALATSPWSFASDGVWTSFAAASSHCRSALVALRSRRRAASTSSCGLGGGAAASSSDSLRSPDEAERRRARRLLVLGGVAAAAARAVSASRAAMASRVSSVAATVSNALASAALLAARRLFLSCAFVKGVVAWGCGSDLFLREATAVHSSSSAMAVQAAGCTTCIVCTCVRCAQRALASRVS